MSATSAQEKRKARSEPSPVDAVMEKHRQEAAAFMLGLGFLNEDRRAHRSVTFYVNSQDDLCVKITKDGRALDMLS